ncbi:uncharacterized protein LOC112151925 [Oryzias melastigma]|uniref:uncharacterized protein LOC112151925 n=1 Tax=Oryzias melastigma TaxID=30732 RepID=UPI000CF805F7|nr:uncharacterized protein LOC112151925 [Oryzias melastigma]
MPFGLHGAPATFQRLMDKVLQGCDHCSAAYLDDVVVFSNTWEEHLQHLSLVLGRIQDAGLTLNVAKCEWAQRESCYLGYLLGGGEVRPQVDKVEAIRNCPRPRTKKEVRSFLGLAGWYRRFVHQFATIAAPLTALTEKRQKNPIIWTDECELAFKTLKAKLCSSPVLKSPDFTKRFLVQVDASAVGLGAVLAQGNPGEEQPVLYLSRKLQPRETRYSTVEKEGLAIKWALDSFRYYLLGREFDLETDHRALTWINTMKDHHSRLTRWYLALQPYKFIVHHRPGRENTVADQKREDSLIAALQGLRASMVKSEHHPDVAGPSSATAGSPRMELPTPAASSRHRRPVEPEEDDSWSDHSRGRTSQHPPDWRPYMEPKIPAYQAGEDIENYLLRFERMAKTWRWPETEWACRLVPLLSGKALEAYTAMDEQQAHCYKDLKDALLLKFDISPETYRQQFRFVSVPAGENPTETYHRLKGFYRRWVRPEQHTKEQIGEIVILEQMLRVLPPDVRTWVKEHEPEDGLIAARLALQYFNAPRGTSFTRPSGGGQRRSIQASPPCPIRRDFNQSPQGTNPAPSQRMAEILCNMPYLSENCRHPQVRALLHPLPVISTPFRRIAMDIVGPLPKSSSGHEYILVVCDYATRFPEAFPLRTITTPAVMRALIQLFSRVGIPDEILTDQGTNFTSRLMKLFQKQLGITAIKTTPYHPQTNGMVERFNQTLKRMLQKFVSDTGKDWDRWLPFLLFAYREVPQASTGFSPFELLYGWEVQGPLDLLKKSWEAKPTDTAERGVIQFVLEMRDRLARYREEAEKNQQEAQRSRKMWYDQQARHRELQPGQKVLLLLPSSSSKLLAKWQGPYTIVRRMGPVTYEVYHPEKKRDKQTYHVNLLKEWKDGANPLPEKVLMVRNVKAEEEMDSDPEPLTQPTSPSLSHLSPEKTTQLLNSFYKVPSLFSAQPGRTTLVEHTIRLKNGQPIRQRPYRVPQRLVGQLNDEVKKMLELGVIEPSNSEWCSPVVIVSKKDGSLRICIDFRKLNAISEFDAYPMPRVDDLLERIGAAKYITTLDLCKGYWQVPLTNTCRQYTAFKTPAGLFQFTVMPFGLHGAPATFQRLMDKVLQGCDHCSAAYLDDVVVFSNTWEEHLQHLSLVLGRIQDAGLTLNVAKCE